MKHDWKKIEREYIRGGDEVTFKSLSGEHSIGRGTISKQAQRHRWMEKRQEYRAAERAIKIAGDDGIDWTAIESEYVLGTDMVTHQSLAEKYRIPVKTVASRAMRGRWMEKRDKHRGNLKVIAGERATEFKLKTMEQINEEDLTIFESIIARGLEGILAKEKVMPQTLLSALDKRRKIYEFITGSKPMPDQTFNLALEIRKARDRRRDNEDR